MIYALRKLIAFVFLGGMFWFIYQDLGNLDKPWFMHALGMIAIAFAFFWLLIPMLVVWMRRRQRRSQNQKRYQKWLAEGGTASISPRPANDARRVVKGTRFAIEPDEQIFFHEKGTLYIDCSTPGFDAAAHIERPIGHPSDVAFPGCRRDFRVAQRTHCYFTNRRIAFAGKNLEIAIPYAELKVFSTMPGGIVFDAAFNGDGALPNGGASIVRFAFTFQNPLIAADILRFAKDGESH